MDQKAKNKKWEQRADWIDKVYKQVIEFLVSVVIMFSLFLFLGMMWGVEGGLLEEWRFWLAVPLLAIINVCYYKVWVDEKSPFNVKRKETKSMEEETKVQVLVKVPKGETCRGCSFLGDMGSYCRLFRTRLSIVLEADDEGNQRINFTKFPQCVDSEVD